MSGVASNIPTSNANPVNINYDGTLVLSGTVTGVPLIKSRQTVSAIDVSAGATGQQLAGGIITSTTAANVQVTLPTVASYITALTASGYTVNVGDVYTLLLTNLGAANTLTIAADAGPTWTIAAGANLAAIAAGSSRIYFLKITGAATGTVY